MNFKPGDKVRVIDPDTFQTKGDTGTAIAVHSNGNMQVVYDKYSPNYNGNFTVANNHGYCHRQKTFEKINHTPSLLLLLETEK